MVHKKYTKIWFEEKNNLAGKWTFDVKTWHLERSFALQCFCQNRLTSKQNYKRLQNIKKSGLFCESYLHYEILPFFCKKRFLGVSSKIKYRPGSALWKMITSFSETNIFRPYFEKTSHDVTVQLGDSAFFECHIFNLHNQTVGINHLLNPFWPGPVKKSPCINSSTTFVHWILSK